MNRDNEKTLNIDFHAGGLSVISAPPGHGKTRILENIIIDIMQTIPQDKTLYYIHFEEPNSETIVHLVNILANQDIAFDNWAAIRNIIHGGSPSITDNTTAAKIAKVKEAIETVREWKDTRRLIVVDNEPPIETISEQITAAARAGKVFAVLIDYAQAIRSTTVESWNRKSLMAYVLGKLEALAKKTQVPIIMTSFLNRQALNPWCLDICLNDNAATIGYYVTKNLLVWNSKFRAVRTDNQTTPSAIINELKFHGFILGIPGSLAVKTAKDRLGQAGDVWAVLRFNERTGRIWQEDSNDEDSF